MYYFLAPLLGWLVAGGLKFIINFVQNRDQAKQLIGNGGFPSNHTTTLTTITSLIGFQEGLKSSVFGLAVGIVMIVIFDATGLRRYVGRHAVELNALQSSESKKHRERVGHTKIEVMGGLVIGTVLGFLLHLLS